MPLFLIKSDLQLYLMKCTAVAHMNTTNTQTLAHWEEFLDYLKKNDTDDINI